NFFPRLPLSRGEIDAEDSRRKLAMRIHEDPLVVFGPAAHLVVIAPAANRPRLAALQGIDVRLLVGSDCCDEAAVVGDFPADEEMYPFRSNRPGLSLGETLDEEASASSNLMALEKNPFSVGKPAGEMNFD